MNFQIQTLRGEQKTLGIQDLLGLLGDSINDEIVIGEDTYRISSAQSIATGGSPVSSCPMPSLIQNLPSSWSTTWTTPTVCNTTLKALSSSGIRHLPSSQQMKYISNTP
jgi:hypothetical protein